MRQGCGYDEARLVAWLDGELAPAEAARVQAHVDGCARCEREVAALRWSYEELAALPPGRPAGGASRRVRQLLRTETAWARRRLVWRVAAVVGLAAAAAVLWVAVPLLVRHSGDTEPSTRVALVRPAEIGAAGGGQARVVAAEPGAAAAAGREDDAGGELASSETAVDPALEREAIAILDVLEAFDELEMVELIEAVEELDDPAWLLLVEEGSG